MTCSSDRRRLGERVDLFLPAEFRGSRPPVAAARDAAIILAAELPFSDVAWLGHHVSHLSFSGKHCYDPRHRRSLVR
uniref:Uncharacterized protein n=1 Tax=Arundo donax TaxID=35708 RepID=A0A0A8XTI4_ARUDO